MNWFNLIVVLFAVNAAVVIVMENRRPADTLAWLSVLLCLPFVGLLLYFFFGKRAIRPLMKADDLATLKTNVEPLASPVSEKDDYTTLIGFLHNNNHAYLTDGNRLDLYTSFSDMLQHLLKDIEAATDHIHFQFFKFEDDELGRHISNLLVEKVRQGVEVRVIYDAAANWNISIAFYRQLKDNGVEVQPFNRILPFLTSFSNYRNHRKVVVIDGKVGYMGGMNIAERYLKGIRTGIWRDTHFRIVGPAVEEMQIAFLSDWYFASKQFLPAQRYFPVLPEEQTAESAKIQIVTSNPANQWNVMEHSLALLIAQTKDYIWLQSPYFMPTDVIMNVLCSVALAGKDVRIMLPAQGDKGILVPKATFSYLDRALSAGIRVFLYDAGYMHAKTIVTDNRVSTIGSVNIDPRSLKLSFEINAFIYDEDIALRQRAIFEHDMLECHELDLATWRRRSFWERLVESFARLFAPLF